MTCGLQALFIKSPRSNQCASWVPWGYSEESYNPIWDSLVWKASQLRVPAASRLRPCHILDGLGYFWFVFSLYPSPLPSLSLSFPSSPSSLLLSSLHQVELARWLPLLWSIVSNTYVLWCTQRNPVTECHPELGTQQVLLCGGHGELPVLSSYSLCTKN